ncbi:hypothetical protein [Devosia sp. SL43]|uniref:hypothetical protein n=1 Tax=Devosia sp. SL43 TaxID=2806348 RepID=UPI001F26F2DD|nr:hypothetical protein [Devosia sp. SL43]UJW84528.1 hypothetical protein IM737_13965 [Devosia sp. SL43]
MALSRGFMRLLGVLLAASAFAGPALAQPISSELPLTEEGSALVLDSLGHTFSLPLPDWLSSADRLSGNVIPLFDATFRADDAQALLEIYPKGESEALWKTLYGARITLEASRPLTDYRSAVMFGYSQTCKPELTGFFQFGEDDGETLAPLGFVCGAYLDRLTAYRGEGEVMVMSFRKSAKGVAIVYQEWRGDAFDPSKPETWPVATDVVEARAKQLQDEAALVLAD